MKQDAVAGRLKEYLDAKGWPAKEFEKRTGLGNGTASKIGETTRNTTYDRISKSPVDLNVEWLRTGEGEMFVQDTQSEQVAAFLADLTKDDSDTFKKRFVEMLAGLSPVDWELLERMAEKLTQKKEESP